MAKGTLVSKSVLKEKCVTEGIDFSQVCTMAPRWAESAPLGEGVKSALVTCDLIIRDDGSVVLLDGCMAMDSVVIAEEHRRGIANKDSLPWEDFVKSITVLAE